MDNDLDLTAKVLLIGTIILMFLCSNYQGAMNNAQTAKGGSYESTRL